MPFSAGGFAVKKTGPVPRNPIGPATSSERSGSSLAFERRADARTAGQPPPARFHAPSETTPARLTAPPSTRERPQ